MDKLLYNCFKFFDTYEDKFSEVKTEIESKIHLTEYYKGPYYELSPYSYQREGYNKGQLIQDLTIIKDYNEIYEYGFDHEGRIVMLKEGTGLNEMFYYTFIRYGKDFKLLLRYDYDEELQSSRIFLCDYGGKVTNMYSAGISGAKHEEYIYKGDVLSLININQYDKSYNLQNIIVHEFIYNDNGELNSIVKYPEDRSYSENIYLY